MITCVSVFKFGLANAPFVGSREMLAESSRQSRPKGRPKSSSERAVAATLLPFPHAQPDRAENSNAVDSLLGGGRNRPISGLVDAAGVRSVMGNHSNSF